eukprot:Nk52_evm12s229 gene=Nk52_evmTU12s229
MPIDSSVMTVVREAGSEDQISENEEQKMSIAKLLKNNLKWADAIKVKEPGLLKELAKKQSPEYLWIGCVDSRVPPNEIVNMGPGKLLTHRNVANLVVHTDLNCLSVLQFGVDVLKIPQIVVCGHYGCGGVQASMGKAQLGLMDNWLRHVREVQQKNSKVLKGITDEKERFDRLCELNVAQQVHNVCSTSFVQNAWARGQDLTVHGLIYNLESGILDDLNLSCSSLDQVDEIFHVTEPSHAKKEA